MSALDHLDSNEINALYRLAVILNDYAVVASGPIHTRQDIRWNQERIIDALIEEVFERLYHD